MLSLESVSDFCGSPVASPEAALLPPVSVGGAALEAAVPDALAPPDFLPPDPFLPPFPFFPVSLVPLAAAVAPVAAIRASRSAAVVHVTLVPAELTRGSAAQLEGWAVESAKKSDVFRREDPHQTTGAGCNGELAVGALRERIVNARDLAVRASRGGGERLELVAVQPRFHQTSNAQ